jgi:ABC-type multidrug transport system fused ATPase/permease subunit
LYRYVTAVALEMLLMLEYKLLDDLTEKQVVLEEEAVLQMTGVNFVYRPPGGGDWRKAPLLFRNVNLLVEPGKKVGIVGKSGSGKSTLCRLLSRLYNPTAGDISVTGVNLRDLHLFSTIAMMEQETLLFDDSVKGNLTVGNDASLSMEQIEFACKTASVHADIIDLDGGYAHQVGVRGRMLSGGQRQRIAIARTLLRNTPIDILDEPTSAQEPGVGRCTKLNAVTLSFESAWFQTLSLKRDILVSSLCFRFQVVPVRRGDGADRP